VIFQHIHGEDLQTLINCITTVTTDEVKLRAFLDQANAETSAYSERVIQKQAKKK